MDILSGIASVLGGGLTGLIGSVTQRVFEYKTKKLEIEANKEKYLHEIEMRKADAAIMQQEWAAKTQVAQIEATAQVDTEDAKAFNTALTSEPKKYYEGTNYTPHQAWLMIVLDFIRGAIRPCLTLYLCAITTIMYYKAINQAPIQAGETIVNTILYLTTSAVLFWFGSRNSKK
jgi:hypothetical protein